MKLFIAKSKSLGDKKAFEVVKKQILQKPDSTIGVAVGKTTDNLYKLISNNVRKNPKLWKKLKLFQIDEKLGISPESPLSFNFEVRQELNELLKILDKKNVFLINGLINPKKTIKDAYKFIKKSKGIDLVILGLGPKYDPHIAYNTTGKSNLNSRMRVVELHPMTCNVKGITLGIKDILETKKALLIAYGKDKAKSLKLALHRKVDMKKASASALQLHKDLYVVVDKEASRLK